MRQGFQVSDLIAEIDHCWWYFWMFYHGLQKVLGVSGKLVREGFESVGGVMEEMVSQFSERLFLTREE